MNRSDQEYFLRRARQEEEAGRQATCLEARVCHEQLASAYRQRCMDPAASPWGNRDEVIGDRQQSGKGSTPGGTGPADPFLCPA